MVQNILSMDGFKPTSFVDINYYSTRAMYVHHLQPVSFLQDLTSHYPQLKSLKKITFKGEVTREIKSK